MRVYLHRPDSKRQCKHAVTTTGILFFAPSGIVLIDVDIYFAVATYLSLITAKNILVKKLDKVGQIGTFFQTDDGYQVTSPEGYVAVDRIGNAVKLVDRLTFSRRNFTAAKSWK